MDWLNLNVRALTEFGLLYLHRGGGDARIDLPYLQRWT